MTQTTTSTRCPDPPRGGREVGWMTEAALLDVSGAEQDLTTTTLKGASCNG